MHTSYLEKHSLKSIFFFIDFSAIFVENPFIMDEVDEVFLTQNEQNIPFFPQIFFSIAMLFIFTSYTANIVALLQSSSNAINSLEALYKSNMEFGVEDAPYTRYWFREQKEPVRAAIYQHKIVPPGKPDRFIDVPTGVERMRQGLFAFHMEYSPGYKLVERTFHKHEKCGLQEIDHLNVISPWFVLPKKSPYKELIKTT